MLPVFTIMYPSAASFPPLQRAFFQIANMAGHQLGFLFTVCDEKRGLSGIA